MQKAKTETTEAFVLDSLINFIQFHQVTIAGTCKACIDTMQPHPQPQQATTAVFAAAGPATDATITPAATEG